MKQKLIELQGEIHKSTIIARDFIISLTIIGRTSRIRGKDREDLNRTSINLT